MRSYDDIFYQDTDEQIEIYEAGMIRKFTADDTDIVMNIWLKANRDAHAFIPIAYWKNHYDTVRDAILDAEVYIAENDDRKSGREKYECKKISEAIGISKN